LTLEVETERTPAASRDLKNVVALRVLITDNAVSIWAVRTLAKGDP